jgi:GxxExxY protein
MEFEELTEKEEDVRSKIVDAAHMVHNALGPGLLEKIYETCLCHELTKRGLTVQKQVAIPVIYDGIKFDEGLRLDLLVEKMVICEIKAVEETNPVWQAQLLSYLRLSHKRIGLLINFNKPLIKNGIRRFVI